MLKPAKVSVARELAKAPSDDMFPQSLSKASGLQAGLGYAFS